jgi:gluconokinase
MIEQAAPSPVIVMGVCGAGKSAVGQALAARLGSSFVEADDFHPSSNKAKMTAGRPLDDADRMPWLEAVGRSAAASVSTKGGVVVACSALKRAYRDILRRHVADAVFVHLSAPRPVLVDRLATRRSHFVGVSLLDSQLAILEPLTPDENGFVLDCNQPLAATVQAALTHLEAVADDGFAPGTGGC